MKKVYFIGIGGIGISALARYYNDHGYSVYGSDKNNSVLIEKLKEEGINIYVGERPDFITSDFHKIIYSEAINTSNTELQKAKMLGIITNPYPKDLGENANKNILIAIAGTHGKSTTTSLASLIFKESGKDFTSIVGTLLKEFDGKNYFNRNKEQEEKFFIIEACEYKRSFLNYKPNILAITNIELDHMDYYKTEDDYIEAYRQIIDNIKTGGYIILNGQEENSKKLIGYREDLNYIIIDNEKYIIKGQEFLFPNIEIGVPGEHILYDGKIAFLIGLIYQIEESKIMNALKNYKGAWRRMELIGKTNNGNSIISDYGHHPTEIKKTLFALKESNQTNKVLVIFQPHQYNRTIMLLKDFKNCFNDADYVIIPNIYESRDTEEDKKIMNTNIFINNIEHSNIKNGEGLDNTLKLINEFDKENTDSIIVLMGAGDVDTLRYSIKFN